MDRSPAPSRCCPRNDPALQGTLMPVTTRSPANPSESCTASYGGGPPAPQASSRTTTTSAVAFPVRQFPFTSSVLHHQDCQRLNNEYVVPLECAAIRTAGASWLSVPRFSTTTG